MMTFETIAPNKKAKLRLPPKKIEVGYGTAKGELGERVFNRCCNPEKKISLSGSIKRGPQGCIEGQKVKRQKMDRRVSLQCAAILKSLTSHRYSWVFDKPVDPVALNIPDYFTVISRPMDLGTIKSKLERNVYFDIDEFAADVRLTFSNAMTYNPPGNDVHLMAKTLSGLFESKWKELGGKSKCEGEHGKSMAETVRNTVTKSCNATYLLQKDTLPKNSQAPELKGIQKISSLAGRHPKEEVPKLSQIPRKFAGKDLRKDKGDGRRPSSGSGKACPTLGLSTCKCSICGDTPCVCASDSERKSCNATHLLQKNTLPKKSQVPELKGIQKRSSLAGRHPKEEVPKLSQIPRKFAGKDLHQDKGDGRRPSSGSGKACPKLGLSTCKCSICGHTPCVCASDSDRTRTSSGSVNGPSGAHICSIFQLTKPATDAASGEVWSTPVFDVQLSPKKALRAAMLLRRFSDAILKANQKMYLDHGYKSDSWKIQQEKERLERMQRDEKARLESQIKAAEVRAEQDKQQRDKKREAARIAIQNMERTAKIENNLEILKELEVLSEGKLYYPGLGSSPLRRFGLFMKDEYISLDDEDEVLNDIEEGEIIS